MVRIAANEPWLAKAPMDLGALGINFPMICSRADAEKAVRSVRYPPKGDRLWGPFHAPFRWGVSMADYMATADDDMICMSPSSMSRRSTASTRSWQRPASTSP
jgi:4-hydroxy-2-oxoheptanedioate aldolase